MMPMDQTNPGGNGQPKTSGRSRLNHGVNERIDEIRGGESITTFAASLGIHKENLRRVLKAGQTPGLELVLAVCRQYDINANWLLFGIEPKKGRDQVALLRESIDADGVASGLCSLIMEAGGFMPDPSATANGKALKIDLDGGTKNVDKSATSGF